MALDEESQGQDPHANHHTIYDPAMALAIVMAQRKYGGTMLSQEGEMCLQCLIWYSTRSTFNHSPVGYPLVSHQQLHSFVPQMR